jgi:hypothetical protein
MIGTEFIPGYGLGNQLFFYIVTRCMALDKGVEYGFINPGQVGNVAQSHQGMYFTCSYSKVDTFQYFFTFNRGA